jgi:hypothetical protein
MEKWGHGLAHRIIKTFEYINCAEHLLQMAAVSFEIKFKGLTFAMNAVHAAGEPMSINLVTMS